MMISLQPALVRKTYKIYNTLFHIYLTEYVQDKFKDSGKVGKSVLVTAINDKCSQCRIKMRKGLKN